MTEGIVKFIDIEGYEKYAKRVLEEPHDVFGYYASRYGVGCNFVSIAEGAFDNNLSEEDIKLLSMKWGETQYSNRKEGDTDIFRRFDALRKAVAYSKRFGQPITYTLASDEYVFIKCSRKEDRFTEHYGYLIPRSLCEIEAYKDYTDTPVDIIGNNPLSKVMPVVPQKTHNVIQNEIHSKQSEIEDKENEIKAKEKEVRAEIERMKREIEEKYKSTFDLLEKKKKDLSQQKEQLETELFVLDANIYGIRCFNGETIKFTQLTTGSSAPKETPLILYQKIRFLDEELSKYVALYDFNGADSGLFEDMLIAREDLRDLFFPKDKSVSLVRITRDNRGFSSGQQIFLSGTNAVMQNVISEYEVYHGKKIAILLRDGENCYIGWTDDERILIDDGNAFLKPETTVEEYGGEEKTNHTRKEIVASRYYLFSAIQGVIDRRIIGLPEGVSILEQSPYIVFSMTDNWLTDKGYGTLSDLIEKYSGKLQVGDQIISTQSLRAERNGFFNDRGIGYNDRTHDVVCEDNVIYPINYIEKQNLHVATCIHNGRPYQIMSNEWNDFKTAEEFLKDRHWNTQDTRDIKVLPYTKKDYYISLEKRDSDFWGERGKKARANFQVFEDEFIDLTFLNSDYLKNILVTRQLGDAFSQYNFSHSIRYLNHMIEFLEEREEEEKVLIEEVVDGEVEEDWRVKLSKWKYRNNVHRMTKYQAKRFVKACILTITESGVKYE